MLRNETLRRRRRRAAAIAVLSIALGSALFLPIRRSAPLHGDGAAYAAIAGRPNVAPPARTPTTPIPTGPLRNRAFQPRVQPFPRAAIDYTPTADAAVADIRAAALPVALAALDGAPAGGGYFAGGAPAPVTVAPGGFAMGGGASPGGGGAMGGHATPPPVDTATPGPTDGGDAPPAPIDPAPATDGAAPSTAPSTHVATAAPTSGNKASEAAAAAPAPVVDMTASSPGDGGSVIPGASASVGAVDAGNGPLAVPPPAGGRPSHGIGAVPEPATWALLLLGFGATGAAMRRRRARALVA
jgi:hypothetical protein